MLIRTRVSERSIAVAALAAAALCPAPARAQTEVVLGARGVEALARRVARTYGDRRPRTIEYATGTLEHALSVMNPNVTFPARPDDARQVDLVVVTGRFTYNGPAPRGAPPARGDALGLIVDARGGAVEWQALWPKRPPVPLARLGRVRVLRHLASGPHGAGGG